MTLVSMSLYDLFIDFPAINNCSWSLWPLASHRLPGTSNKIQVTFNQSPIQCLNSPTSPVLGLTFPLSTSRLCLCHIVHVVLIEVKSHLFLCLCCCLALKLQPEQRSRAAAAACLKNKNRIWPGKQDWEDGSRLNSSVWLVGTSLYTSLPLWHS